MPGCSKSVLSLLTRETHRVQFVIIGKIMLLCLCQDFPHCLEYNQIFFLNLYTGFYINYTDVCCVQHVQRSRKWALPNWIWLWLGLVKNLPKWDDEKIQTQKRRALGLNEYELVVGKGIGHNKFIFKISFCRSQWCHRSKFWHLIGQSRLFHVTPRSERLPLEFTFTLILGRILSGRHAKGAEMLMKCTPDIQVQ